MKTQYSKLVRRPLRCGRGLLRNSPYLLGTALLLQFLKRVERAVVGPFNGSDVAANVIEVLRVMAEGLGERVLDLVEFARDSRHDSGVHGGFEEAALYALRTEEAPVIRGDLVDEVAFLIVGGRVVANQC